jgi:hypothetical protein
MSKLLVTVYVVDLSMLVFEKICVTCGRRGGGMGVGDRPRAGRRRAEGDARLRLLEGKLPLKIHVVYLICVNLCVAQIDEYFVQFLFSFFFCFVTVTF